MSSGFFKQVWAIVAQIPRGKVASYGQIAVMLGNPQAARTVGWALHSIPNDLQLPWHRVINSNGRISRRCQEHELEVQRRLLEAEGVEFSEEGQIDMGKYQWRPSNDFENI